jgi:hypothetical protein
MNACASMWASSQPGFDDHLFFLTTGTAAFSFFTVGPTLPKADQSMIAQTIRRAATLYRTRFLAIATLVMVVWLPLELVSCYLEAYVFAADDFRSSFKLASFFDNFIGIIATAAVISVGAAGCKA